MKDLPDLHYFVGLQAAQSLVQLQVRQTRGPQVVKGREERAAYATLCEDVIWPGPLCIKRLREAL